MSPSLASLPSFLSHPIQVANKTYGWNCISGRKLDACKYVRPLHKHHHSFSLLSLLFLLSLCLFSPLSPLSPLLFLQYAHDARGTKNWILCCLEGMPRLLKGSLLYLPFFLLPLCSSLSLSHYLLPFTYPLLVLSWKWDQQTCNSARQNIQLACLGVCTWEWGNELSNKRNYCYLWTRSTRRWEEERAGEGKRGNKIG